MERLTFDGLFCDLAVCQEFPCKYPDTGCSQRQVWERLKAIEDILGNVYDLGRLRELVEDKMDDKTKIALCKEIFEQSAVCGMETAKAYLEEHFSGGWISVKDRLPEDGKWVLVWNSIFGYDIDKINKDGLWACNIDAITHWMPIPEPPKEVAE